MDFDISTLMGGYTQEQLEASFKIVRNAEHWKLPIDCFLPSDTPQAALNQLDFAITYFTGSIASFQRTRKGIRVRAPGYYEAVGA
jgi:hypothetical protein